MIILSCTYRGHTRVHDVPAIPEGCNALQAMHDTRIVMVARASSIYLLLRYIDLFSHIEVLRLRAISLHQQAVSPNTPVYTDSNGPGRP